jgi:hypothetical protein
MQIALLAALALVGAGAAVPAGKRAIKLVDALHRCVYVCVCVCACVCK